MGDHEGQVPLAKLAEVIRKLPKKLEPSQVTDVKARLRALDAVRPKVPLPRGPMPSMKGAPGDARTLSRVPGEPGQRRTDLDRVRHPHPAGRGEPRPGHRRRGRGRRPQRGRQVHPAATAGRRPRARLRPGGPKPVRVDRPPHPDRGFRARRDRPRRRRPRPARPRLGGGRRQALGGHPPARTPRPRHPGGRTQRRRAAAGGAGRAAAGRTRPAGTRRAHEPSRRRGRGLAGRPPQPAPGRRHRDAGGQPRPVVPGRGLQPGLGGPRRGGGRLRRRLRRLRAGSGGARPTGRSERVAAAEPAAQGAGLAAPRAARAHLQAEVPDRRGQRADRRRPRAPGQPAAARVRNRPVGQGRVRPRRCRLRAARRAGAVRRPGLVDRSRGADRHRRRERFGQDHPAAPAGRRTGSRARPGEARPNPAAGAPDPGRVRGLLGGVRPGIHR